MEICFDARKMVKLTVDLIARGTSGYTKKKRDESINHYLKRLTHLYLEDRGIDDVGEDIGLCRNLSVLYLYDNMLTQIPNLLHNPNLTHLYLQNNEIQRIEYLSSLRRLTKLFLGGNRIAVVEGIEKLDQLEELHLENQKLPSGEKLLFDPRSLLVLTKSLQVLNVSGNNLDSIAELEPMLHLTQFMAGDNQLTEMKELTRCLSAWHRLWRLDLLGNPLCHKSKYRDRVIIVAPGLRVLDGKEVTETSKRFLQNWQANKEAIKRKRSSHNSRQNSELESSNDLPPVSSHPHLGNVPGYIMPALPKKQFQEVLARSASHPSNMSGQPRSELSPPNKVLTACTTECGISSSPSSMARTETYLLINTIHNSEAGDARNSKNELLDKS